MEKNKPLSRYGVGPFYAGSVFGLTAAALVLEHQNLLPRVQLPASMAAVPAAIAAVLVVSAALLWFNAVFAQKLAQHIRQNELVTSGAYRWVRNPIYTAIMFAMWGLLLLCGNLLLLLLCPVYYVLMTVMVKHTEEKWLAQRYGEQYLDYCRRVNRCIPRPPGKRGV